MVVRVTPARLVSCAWDEHGLTRLQAEARMRELTAETQLPASTERLTFEEAGRRYVRHLDEVMQRKPSTIKDYRIIVARGLWGRTSARRRSGRSRRTTSPRSTTCLVQPRVLWLTAAMMGLRLVFCHPQTGGPYDASKSRVRFKAALKRASLRELRFHDLRHTYGTLMAAVGTPLRTLQGWMGHRDYKTTEIYADFAPDPTQGAKWAERAFGSAANGTEDVAERGRLF